jgi:catechol 2,3-dioxygenase-like lactoylglutathione lyase family enzyme
MFNGIHHISLSTLSIEPMVAFYGDLLGLEVISRQVAEPATPEIQAVVGLPGSGYRHAWLRGGNVVIEIFEYTTPRGAPGMARPACDTGIRHICFDVTDLKYEYDRLSAAAVPFLSEPQYLSSGSMWSVYGHDPDGNIFELQEILPESKVTARLQTFAPLHS